MNRNSLNTLQSMHRHKFILPILLSLLLSCHAEKSSAKCRSSYFNVFPQSQTISANPIFIVEGLASSQAVIRDLNKCNKIYLTSDNDTVPLKVLKTLEGQHRLTQALLKPVSKLTAGKQYKLNIDGLDEYQRSGFPYSRRAWTVSDIDDNQNPKWIISPFYNSKWVLHFGCGPAAFVNFCACISEISPVMVHARVKNILTNSMSEYYITPDSSFFQLGGGICGAEFVFERGQEYEATFSLMDASGNVSAETPPVKFISPSGTDYIKEVYPKVICDCPPPMIKEKSSASHLWLLVALGIVGLVVGVLALMRKSE